MSGNIQTLPSIHPIITAVNSYKKETGWQLESFKALGAAFTIIFVIGALAIAGHFFPALSSFTNLMGCVGSMSVACPTTALSFIFAQVSFIIIIHRTRAASKKLESQLATIDVQKEAEKLNENLNKLEQTAISWTEKVNMKMKQTEKLNENLNKLEQTAISWTEKINIKKKQADNLRNQVEALECIIRNA